MPLYWSYGAKLVRKYVNIKEEYPPDESIFDDLRLNFELPDKKASSFIRVKAAPLQKYRPWPDIYFEMIPINDEIRSLILKKTSSNEIKEVAIRYGMKTLLDSGIAKALAGITSIDEVFRVAV